MPTVQTATCKTQDALTENAVKGLNENECKGLVGDGQRLSVSFEEMIIQLNADTHSYSGSGTTIYDYTQIKWQHNNVWDNIGNRFGYAYDMFSGTPETTAITVDGGGVLTSGITKGWYKVLDAQAFTPERLVMSYGNEANPPYGILSLGSPASPHTNPTWCGGYAASGWTCFYSTIHLTRGMAHYSGPLTHVPYFVFRVRSAYPDYGLAYGTNPFLIKCDLISSGFLTGAEASSYEVPFPAGTIIPQPSPIEPFDSGSSLTALTNPLSHDSYTAVLPILTDVNMVVLGDDPSSFATAKGFAWGVWGAW